MKIHTFYLLTHSHTRCANKRPASWPYSTIASHLLCHEQDFQRAVVEKDIDGRVLSTITKAEMRSLARNAGLHKGSRRRLFSVIDDLKAGGADGEWVALHGSKLLRVLFLAMIFLLLM